MDLTTVGYWGAYPEKNEATSCYLLQEDGLNILLDCGSGALAKLQNYIALEQLDAVIISHTHTDHMADMYSLEYAMLIQTQLGKRKQPLKVYIYGENLDNLPFEFPHIMQVQPISLNDTLTIGQMHFTFQENLHEIPCVAIKVQSKNKTLVYTADTGKTEKIQQFSKDADVLLIECSFFERQRGVVKGHLSTVEVAEIVNFAQPKRVVLTHFPHYGTREQLLREVQSYTNVNTMLAHEGFTITI